MRDNYYQRLKQEGEQALRRCSGQTNYIGYISVLVNQQHKQAKAEEPHYGRSSSSKYLCDNLICFIPHSVQFSCKVNSL